MRSQTNSVEHIQGLFWGGIWAEPDNRRWLFRALGAFVILMVIYKYLFQYPDLFSDSYSFIYGASANLDINIWPIGYSKYLRIIHGISSSDLFLIATQFVIFQAAGLYFFFTFRYYYRLSKLHEALVFLFLFCNPMFCYLCNQVGSDWLFAALSLFWLSELIRVINGGPIYRMGTQAVLLFLCFSVRNTGYYYPIIAAVCCYMAPHLWWKRAAGMAVPLVLIVPFVIHTENEAEKLTGTRQFSLFTGWQLANNALYGYDYMSVDSAKLTCTGCRELNRMSKEFYSRMPGYFHDSLANYTGNFFIKDGTAPLKAYMERHYEMDDEHSLVVAWGKASSVYAGFGSYLIRNHPVAFVRGFVLPNVKNYFLPPLNNFETYNMGSGSVWPIGEDWFNWKSPDVSCLSKKIPSYLFFVFPMLFLFLNLYLLGGTALLVIRRSWRFNNGVGKLVFVFLFFMVMNFGFTVVTAMNILRYQAFPMLICLVSVQLISEQLGYSTSKKPGKNKQATRNPLVTETPKSFDI